MDLYSNNYEVKGECRIQKKQKKTLLSHSQFLSYFTLTKFLTDLVGTVSR